MAEDFVEQFSITFPVYTDPKRITYKHMGFKRSHGISWGSLSSAGRALFSGHKQGQVLGDPWQQGGEALFAQDGSILWAHAANQAGSHASAKEILAGVTSALKGR